MPVRIRQDLLNSTIYLYEDEKAARAGKQAGASGFLFGQRMPDPHSQTVTMWAVTNAHVIRDGGWTIRLNGKGNDIEVIDTTEPEWFFAEHDDLAVRPIALSHDIHIFNFIRDDWLLTEEDYRAYGIGPGDSCFVVGRFINHDGIQRNTPTARFGQLAQAPNEMVEVGGFRQESFLVEVRSIGGYSGSPVFLHLDPAYRREIGVGTDSHGRQYGPGAFTTDMWLLGVDWCMVPTWERVCDNQGVELANESMVPANSGMMGVIPAWKLRALMDSEPVAQRRKTIEDLSLLFERSRAPGAVKTTVPPLTD